MHRGLAEGLVDAIGGAEIDTFAAHPPRVAGCQIGLRKTS
jgi:hypothetical protein